MIENIVFFLLSFIVLDVSQSIKKTPSRSEPPVFECLPRIGAQAHRPPVPISQFSRSFLHIRACSQHNENESRTQSRNINEF